MTYRHIVYSLGYAGLIPFVLAAGLVAAQSDYAHLASIIAGAYAFGIICFLTGSWWGMAREDNRAAILFSNLYFLVAFLLFLAAPDWWPLGASILLIGIFALEQSPALFPSTARYYRKMRAILTLVSSIAMGVIHVTN